MKSGVWACGLVAALLSSCERSKAPDDGEAAEALPDAASGPVVDPKLAAAMAAASAAAAPSQPNQADGGPPPGGIFGPGEANAQIAPGARSKIALGGTGSEPRVALGLAYAGPAKLKGQVTLIVQNDPRQGALPLKLGVDFESKVQRATSDAGPPSVDAQAKVTEDLVKRVGKLKGARISYTLLPDGSVSNFERDVPRGVDEEIASIFRSFSDVLATVTLPVPSEPVGTGAYWMGTSREGVMGLDLVTYRMIKVDKVNGERVAISLNTKRYATGKEFAIEGLSGDFTLEEFKSTADGTLSYVVGSPLPVQGQLDLVLAASLVPKGQPDARGSLQTQTRVKLELEPVASR
jgi:hypothetical protein